MKETIYTVAGFSHGRTKAEGKPFTKVFLTFEPPYDTYTGHDGLSVFIYDDIDVRLGDAVYLVYGCRRDGKAYVKDIIPAR